ncbi:MAG: PAS domain S-box protein [Thermoplasmata archaeon]|nr:MAG: PAS domain S-box protein [Thermoplasmata archaeon]
MDALAQSEKKFRILAENSPNAIFIDKKGKIVYANKKTEEITGYSREELYSPQFSFLNLVVPEEREKARKIYIELLTNGGTSLCECAIVDGHGGRKEILVNATVIPYEDEEAMLCIVTDITKIKETEKEVRKLNQYLESIIENANVWLDVLDEEGNIVIWNKAAEEISGYTKEEVVGHAKIWEWLYPDEEYRKKIFSKEMAMIKEGDVVENFETEIRAKDGKKKIISWHSKNLIDEEGRPIGLVALGIDITEMKQMQEKLMEHLKMASLGRLAAVVAHELNTPLANIAITAEYLASKIGEEHEEEIRIIKEEVKNASSIIKEILSFSRMGKIEWGEIDIKNVVESAIERVKKICDTNDIIIQNRVDSHKVLGDEQRLLQCFVNIIKNAVMAKDDKKDTHYVIIDLIEREKEEEVEIKIIDNGVGMDKNVQKDAMKPFFTTRPLGEGSGLGLFIANWIIKQHGGKISIESEKGKGTEVSILLHKVKK